VGVFRHSCAKWNRYLGRQLGAFRGLRVADTEGLEKGEMWFWAKDWLYVTGQLSGLSTRLLRVKLRPRVSHHGGRTRTAVPE
jgi:hypothetical protein